MPERYPAFCQVVGGQLNRNSVTCKHLDVVLAHLAGQVSQYFVALGYLYFKCSVPHTLNYGSINGDHVFLWNGAYLLFKATRPGDLVALSFFVTHLADR